MKRRCVALVLVLVCACDETSSTTAPTPSSKPPPAASAAPATAPSPERARGLALEGLKTWVDAQNRSKIDAYLGHYDPTSFRGVIRTAQGDVSKLAFPAWKERRSRMLKKGVRVAADEPKAVTWIDEPALGAGVVEVRFVQRYRSGRYADHGPKVLRFMVTARSAKIIYEELVRSTKGWDAEDDAGAEDAGAEDAGPEDAGPEDGGPADAGPGAKAFACKGRGFCDAGESLGLCRNDVCRTCKAGFELKHESTRCHPVLDCASHKGMTPVKTAQCEECMLGVCFSAADAYEPNW